MKPAYIDAAFGAKSLRLSDVPSEIRFKVHRLGSLNLPSGQIIACDPFIPADGIPFVDSVAPGRYPVSLSIAAVGDERRVAFAKLEISNAAVRGWRLAEHDTDRVDVYGLEFRLGYGVDWAMGCFMDVQVVQLLYKVMEEDPYYHQVIIDAAYANATDRWQWADIRPDPNSDLNIILFESGWGDGFYSSYAGLDEADQIACLVTDFDVLPESHRKDLR